MPLGDSDTNKTYLSISFGKLRKKVNEATPGAVSRINKIKETVWELVYGFITGKITNILYKEHSEYGNSFEITFDDGNEKYNVSLPEDSKYCQDFLSRLPNLDLSHYVTLSPYDFKPQDSEKNKKGLTLKQNGVKIENYFVTKEDDKYIFSHGYPETDGQLSKADWKIYVIRLQEFLKKFTIETIIPKLTETKFESQSEATPSQGDNDSDDDLPF